MSNTTASDPNHITPLKAPTTSSSSSTPDPSPMVVAPSTSVSTNQPASTTTPTSVTPTSSQQPTSNSNTVPTTAPSPSPQPLPSNSPAPNPPAPNQPAPNQPAPNQPAPNQPAPNQPAPNQPAPIQPAPNQPAPNQPSPNPPAPNPPSPNPPDRNDPSPPQITNSPSLATNTQDTAPVAPTPVPEKTSVTLVPTFVTITLKPTSPGEPTVVTVIQTSTKVENIRSSLGSSTSASSSTSPAQLQSESSSNASGGSGLTGGGKIAVAVVVPILVVTLVVIAALFLWRKRKQRKDAEELRRKEVEEYGYNPNHDPTYPALENSGGHETFEKGEDIAGYRGWGSTGNASARKPSTTLSGGNSVAGVGLAFSEAESPTHGTMSDTRSDNALIVDRPKLGGNSDSQGVMSSTTSPTNISETINRGISNASTSSSSGDVAGVYRNKENVVGNYAAETSYENPAGRAEMAAHPIIRDVQARRNTRIESPSHYPQQSSGISQNF